jgi:hypothetical protein
MPIYTQKILNAESVIVQIARKPNIGGFKALEIVTSFMKRALHNNFLKMVRPADYMNEFEFRWLMELRMNAEEIAHLEKRRLTNRALIQESIINIFNNAGSSLSMQQVKDLFMRVVDQLGNYQYLSPHQIKEIQEARIVFIDIDWIFQEINMEGIDTLMRSLHLTARDAFMFFDRLDMTEKENLLPLIRKHTEFLKTTILPLLKAGIPFDKAFSDLQSILTGQVSQFPYWMDEHKILAEQLNLKFIDIALTHQIRLGFSSSKIQEIFTQQSFTNGNLLLNNLLEWRDCQFENKCPAMPPKMIFPFDNTTLIPAKILTMVEGSFTNLAVKINDTGHLMETFIKNPDNIELIRNTMLSENISEIQFNAFLRQAVEKNILKKIVLQTTFNLNNKILENDFETKEKLTNSLQTWATCVVVIQSMPNTTQICQSLWNATLNLVSSSASEIYQLSSSAASVATSFTVDVALSSTGVTRSEATANSSDALFDYALPAVGSVVLVTAIYSAYRFFTAKKPHTEYHLLPTTEPEFNKNKCN